MEATEQINRAATFVDYTVKTDKDGNQKAIKNEYGALPIRFMAVTRDSNRNDCLASEINHSVYKRELQKYYWRIIFQKLNMEKYATRELKEQINRYIEQRQSVPFTMTNIYRVIETVIKTNGQRMVNALCEAFDTICSLSAENSEAGEHWKTNANYMVNRRFIVDYMTERSTWDDKMEIRWSSYRDRSEMIDDVCKALCYMTGQSWGKFGSIRNYVNNHKDEIVWGQWFEFAFFRCRGYKKGTMHFEFLDENVWYRFNQEVAKRRGWNIGSKTKSKGHK